MGRLLSTDDDPLNYLPRKPIMEFAKGTTIYSSDRPNEHLYVTVLGRVKVSSTADDGCQTVTRIVRGEGLFGESSLVGGARSEAATALDNVSAMAWSRAEIEKQIEKEPQLGIALTIYFARQCVAFQDRIESMALHKTPERVLLALVLLGEELGSPMPDGAFRIASLTHQTIAEFVGTSREIVTFQMNRLRRMGMLGYSRRFIDVYVAPLRDSLREQGIQVRRHAEALRGASSPAAPSAG